MRVTTLTLLYPMIDDRNTTRSSREIIDVGVWDREANLLAWNLVLGDRAGAVPALARGFHRGRARR